MNGNRGYAMRKHQPLRLRLNNKGFTLAELLVGLFVSGIVMTTILSAYYTQNKSYAVQDQLAAMVQNLRAAMDIMIRETRMAGYDPTGNADARIVVADQASLTITEDMNGDGSITGDESITYSLADSDGDGDNDLERNSNLIAENIDALDFVYLDENDASTTIPSEIKSIQITMVAKTQKVDQGYHDTITYTNQGGAPIFGPANDSFRRRRLTAEVKCRNLGL
jgi:type IV pilus assembly protein PilW